MANTQAPDLSIVTNQVGKRFGRSWIIKDFNENFNSGEVIGVKGRNGSGKSTLLRLLCGQLTPSRGEVERSVAGKQCPLQNWYQHVSWTGPYTEIIEELSIEELFSFHFGLKPLRTGLSLREIPAIIELESARKRPLLDCSSGMRQRVLLATALYAATPLLLLDEPTITLDDEARSWFHEQLSEAKQGRLVVIASNDDYDLKQCTRIITLNSAI